MKSFLASPDFVSELLGQDTRERSVMAKIFWVSCPKCAGEFYCHAQELRHKKVPLLCPYCSHRFLDENSPKIVE